MKTAASLMMGVALVALPIASALSQNQKTIDAPQSASDAVTPGTTNSAAPQIQGRVTGEAGSVPPASIGTVDRGANTAPR